MFELNATKFILFLQSLPPELVSIFSLLCCYAIMMSMAKIFKAQGLLVYNVVAVIACNLQVLKGTEFSFYASPIALGTITYASSFLASDALTEVYGANYARKCLFLSFAASITLLLMMIFTLGHKDVTSNDAAYAHFHQAHVALSYIFTPNFAIVSASLTAYILSQLSDIYIFAKLKALSSALWFRTFVSLGLSAILDSIIFNTLAWKVFSPYEISWHNIFFNYMISGYLMQLLVAFFNIFAMYLLLRILKYNKLNAIS
jgi:uncharacterized integral membrane protein (TIGR00697 family)